jgi:23S rRNA (uracil1939-C5)-methyltransferase
VRGRASTGPALIAEVVDLAHDGRGVAQVEGKTAFVHGALPGERVSVIRARRKGRHDEAELLEVLEASADRVQPGCPHFGICGGCALQHLSAVRQIEHKESLLLQNLERIGGVTPERILRPLTADSWGYRRRARLGVRWVAGKQRVLVGFRERRSGLLADIERCGVLAPPAGDLIQPLARVIERLSLRDRLPQIEVAVAENATALVFRVLDEPTAADRAALAEFGAAHRVLIYLQPGGYESIVPLAASVDDLAYSLPQFDLKLAFAPADFVQVHAELNRSMIEHALSLLDPQAGDCVLDLFCGIGNFSLPLARRAAQVVGVEGDAALVARARGNATLNGIANVEFATADLFEDVSGEPWAQRRYDRVLLDPPRAGAAGILGRVRAFAPDRLVYISCHPETLARDAGLLAEQLGYRLTAAGVMDMFPHTAHVESIAVFEPGSAAGA